MATNEQLREIVEELDALPYELKKWDQGFIIDVMENEIHHFSPGQQAQILRMEREYLLDRWPR